MGARPDDHSDDNAVLRPTRAQTEIDHVVDEADLAGELDRMARFGDTRAAVHFRGALRHPSALVQIAAARGLAECGDAGDAAVLTQILCDAVPSAQPVMIQTIGVLGDASCATFLLGLLGEPRALPQTDEVLVACADALGRIGSRAALPALDTLAGGSATVAAAAEKAADAIRLGRSRETYDPVARLIECLARFDTLLAAGPIVEEVTDPRIEITDPIGALLEMGVTFEGAVPRDLAVWAVWCNRPAPALRWSAARGWHFLSLADALSLRAALLLGDAAKGPWLPLMSSDFGDHQVYVPRTWREGLVHSCLNDEPLRPAGEGKPLVDHAWAVMDAWTTLEE